MGNPAITSGAFDDVMRYAMSQPKPVPQAPAGHTGIDSYGKWLVPAALAGTALYALHQGTKTVDEQEARMTDLNNARQFDMSATLPSLAVKQSHDDFAQRKLASIGEGHGLSMPQPPPYHSAASGALAQAMVDFGVKQPLHALQGIVKKKFYTEPKQRHILDQVLASDPELMRYHQEQPDIMDRTYKTLKSFGPSLAMDHNAVRNFLQQGMTVGGNIDYATIGTLADTEKKIRAARGEIGATL